MALFGRKNKKADSAYDAPTVPSVKDKKESASTPKEESPKKTPSKKVSSGKLFKEDLSWVLEAPRISEKAVVMSDQGIYTFRVSSAANKIQIKKAIQTKYNVVARKVRITIQHGKKVRRRTGSGSTSGFKKAVVYLRKGDTIEII